MKVESYFIWWECLGLWAQETASQELWENCSKEAGGEVRLYMSLQQREQAVWTNNDEVKEFSILCMGRCKSLGSLNSFLSCIPQLSEANPVSLFTLLLHCPSSSAINVEGCSICWITVWGGLINILPGFPCGASGKEPACQCRKGEELEGLKWLSTEHIHSHLEARNHWGLWNFLSTDMAGNIFISQAHSRCSTNISWINIWVNSLRIIKDLS